MVDPKFEYRTKSLLQVYNSAIKSAIKSSTSDSHHIMWILWPLFITSCLSALLCDEKVTFH